MEPAAGPHWPVQEARTRRKSLGEFCVQFLDGCPELYANCLLMLGMPERAILLVLDRDWPPRAVTLRVLDVDGREVHSAIKGDAKRQRLRCKQRPKQRTALRPPLHRQWRCHQAAVEAALPDR